MAINDPKIRHTTIYPDDVIAADTGRMDVIDPDDVGNISGLFNERVRRSPQKVAYVQHDADSDTWIEYSWQQMADDVHDWCRAINADGLDPGERAAIRMKNCREWVLYDQATIASGLVVVPVYAEDRPDNIAYILEQTQARLYFVENAGMWMEMREEMALLSSLVRVVVLNVFDNDLAGLNDSRVVSLKAWLESAAHSELPVVDSGPDALATIVYTSGTTGKPKGVMLSHVNMLSNAHAGLKSVAVYPEDKFLSFLPLSHMFERTVGYYLTMMAGASVVFNRSIPDLLDDLAISKPTAMITVPRIFERAYAAVRAQLEEGPALKRWLFGKAVEVGWQRFEIDQGRAHTTVNQLLWPVLRLLVANRVVARFGGNLRFVVSGGAPLAPRIARTFIGLGIRILQGYGLTECSPTISVNTVSRNRPASIGLPFIGTEVRLADNGELQARSTSVMLGYWQNDAATRQCIDSDGWLATGDIASIAEDGFISITGRLKEIIVMANGEKAPPADMESAICDDPLFEQAMVIGEGRAFLAALIVLSPDTWPRHARRLGIDPSDDQALESEKMQQIVLDKITAQLQDFPGYAVVRKVCISQQPWTVHDGAITPTLKLKRPVLRERFKAQIEKMYEGH